MELPSVAFTLLPRICVFDRSRSLSDVSISLLLPTIWISVRFLPLLFLATTLFLEPVTVIPVTSPASLAVAVSGSPLTTLPLPVTIMSSSFLGVDEPLWAMDAFSTLLLLPTIRLLSPSIRFSFPKIPEFEALTSAAVPVAAVLFWLPRT